jgi:hypothetical protein
LRFVGRPCADCKNDLAEYRNLHEELARYRCIECHWVSLKRQNRFIFLTEDKIREVDNLVRGYDGFYLGDEQKRCRDCLAVKPIDEFSKGKNYKGGRRSTCGKCVYDKKKRHEKNSVGARIALAARNRISMCLRRDSLTKSVSTFKLIGCRKDEYLRYLESLFEPEMTWENYGVHGWHIDHIVPISSFDLTDSEELKKAFHYTNTRPLWAADNWKKGSKI